MKHTFLTIFLLVGFSLLSPLPANDANDARPAEGNVVTDLGDGTYPNKLIHEIRLASPYGESQWVATVPQPVGESPLRFVYLPEASCPRSPYIDLYVHKTGNPFWEKTDLRTDDLDYYSGGSLDGLKIVMSQPLYGVVTCTFRVYSAVGLVTTPPVSPGKETLAGSVKFTGGFMPTVTLPLSEKPFITAFRVHVPKFCKDVEVAQGGTLTEGIYEASTPLDKGEPMFNVNEGAGSRVSAIQLALNGPGDSTCDLLIYTTSK